MSRILLLLTAGLTLSSFALSRATQAADGEYAQAIPVLRILTNLYQLDVLEQGFETTWGGRARSEMLESFGDMLEGEQPQPDWKIMQQIDLFASRPGNLFEVAYPRESQTVRKALRDEDIHASEHATDEKYLVLCVSESSESETDEPDNAQLQEAYRENLRITLSYLADQSDQSALRIEVLPSNLPKTHANSRLQGLLAAALTQAQRRDDELDADHAVRASIMKLVADAGRLCLNNLDSLAADLSPGRRTGEIDLTLTVAAREDSPLHRLFHDVVRGRNRTVAWLHPSHTGFLTISIPFPQGVADSLNQYLNVIDPTDLFDSSFWPLALMPLEQLQDSDRDSGRLELLVQTVPCSDGSTAVVLIWPRRSASAGNIRQVSWLKNSSVEINGTPVFQDDPIQVGEHNVRLSALNTEQCVAAVIGTDAALDLLTEILQRDFDETPTARRHARSTFAADLPLDDLVLQETLQLENLSNTLRDLPSAEARLSIDTTLDGSDLVARLHCQKHASVTGLDLAARLVEIFSGCLQYVTED